MLPWDTEGVTLHLVRQLAAGDELKWTTTIPPTSAEHVTLVFTGSIGDPSQPATGWDLLINGKSASGVTFDVPTGLPVCSPASTACAFAHEVARAI